jgi:hypothetical protein
MADLDDPLRSYNAISVLWVYFYGSDLLLAICPKLMLQVCERLPSESMEEERTLVTASMSVSIPCSLATRIASTNSSLVPHRVDLVPRRVNSPRSHYGSHSR